MCKKILPVILLLALLPSLAWSQGIRKAVYAGSWYEGDPEKLSRLIDNFLQQVKGTPSLTGEIRALIVPHAGYPCSGPIAAHAYRLIHGKDFETVVIIGTDHKVGFRGCSIYTRGGYETPLGLAEIDEALASELSKVSGFKYIPQAHREEHSVEIQIPFIQKTIPQAKIVPIVMGFPTKKTISTLSDALTKVLRNKNVLVIASTDMSHFFPKKKANNTDTQTISLIKSLKTNSLISKLERKENILCGGGPVVSSLLYVQKLGETKVEVLNYSDSSQTCGSESQVVGYLAAAICAGNPAPEFTLSSEEKSALLQIARSAITLLIQENKILDYKAQNTTLLAKRGVFVTLRKKGSLRGCIGFIKPILPLYQTVIQAAIYAATRDVRFPPVSSLELKDIDIEISVLTPLKKISNPGLIKVGKHGLLISTGERSGLLLPQIPVENHWSRVVFLQQACLKAGLPQDAWKSGADLFVFEAIVFH